MKIRSAVPVADGKNRKEQKTSVKHTHPPHRRLRKLRRIQSRSKFKLHAETATRVVVYAYFIQT